MLRLYKVHTKRVCGRTMKQKDDLRFNFLSNTARTLYGDHKEVKQIQH